MVLPKVRERDTRNPLPAHGFFRGPAFATARNRAVRRIEFSPILDGFTRPS